MVDTQGMAAIWRGARWVPGPQAQEKPQGRSQACPPHTGKLIIKHLESRGEGPSGRSHWPREDSPGKGTRPRSGGGAVSPKDTLPHPAAVSNLGQS